MNRAQEVRAAMDAIFHAHGVVTPEQVVEDARAEDHVLHREFEWDNDEAAHRYRLSQARQLIRSVKVSVLTDEDRYEVRWYHALRNTGEDRTGYVPDPVVRDDPDKMKFLLQTMKREWAAAKRRYGHRAEFWQMVREEMPPVEQRPKG
jgi:hypothetical protein